MNRKSYSVYSVIITTHDRHARLVRAEVFRNGNRVAHASGHSPRSAIQAARVALYNAAIPEREGHDRFWLRRYNARYSTNAPSLHDK